jgi:hypothetical protein
MIQDYRIEGSSRETHFNKRTLFHSEDQPCSWQKNTSHVYHVGAEQHSTCAPNHTSTSRLRGFRRSRDTLAPSWYAGGSSWKTNYMVLMNLAGPEARRNFTTTSDSPACCGQPYNLPDPTGLLYHTVLLFQYVTSLCHSLDILWSSSLK